MSEQENTEALFEHQRIVVDPKQSPVRIDKFLLDRLFKVSRNRIQNGVKDGAILVDGKQVKVNHKIKPGEVITVSMPHPPKLGQGVEPENIPLDIVYEDDVLMVIHKPPGMVVHPGVGVHSGTLVNALAYYLQNTDLPVMEGNLADRPGLVHRIDKNTSGLMVIAKTSEAMTHLAKQFFDHSIERKYVAFVWGEPDDEQGTIEGHIGRHPQYRTMQHVFAEGEEGKAATTHYKVLERLYYVSLVECQLETGRTHQIRVHFKHIGHPLFNDEKYGGDTVRKGTVFSKYKQFVHNSFKMIPRHALHAKSIGFVHPVSGQDMFFDSELPEDMASVLEKWRGYLSSRKNPR